MLLVHDLTDIQKQRGGAPSTLNEIQSSGGMGCGAESPSTYHLPRQITFALLETCDWTLYRRAKDIGYSRLSCADRKGVSLYS